MKIILIPSSKLLPQDIQKKIGKLPSVLYPLNGKTMLEWIYEKYKCSVDKFYVSTFENSLLLKDFIRWKKLPVEIIENTYIRELGDTISECLKIITERNKSIENLIINFGDTLIEDKFEIESDKVFYAKLAYSKEWTYFHLNDKSTIESIFDKNIIDNISEINRHSVFAGFFSFSDIGIFHKILNQKTQKNCHTDSFYTALQEYSKHKTIKFVQVEKWFDVGHIENIVSAKTGVYARSFNKMSIDENRGIIRKTSQHTDKFIHEIMWYLKIPKDLKYLIPHIYDYSIDMTEPFIKLEYYGYHTLHELLIFGQLPLVKWQKIFMKLLFIVEDMENYYVHGNNADVQASLRDIYISKTLSRLEQMRTDANFSNFFCNEIIVNGKKYNSLDNLMSIMPEIIYQRLIKNFDGKFNVIHGDLCFSNILAEENINFMRLIDPRGKFGAFDIYGDKRYELAKIFHTLEGNYDYIIEDIFDIYVIGTSIELKLPDSTKKIFLVFQDIFCSHLNKVEDIRMIEALLFLSMIPLHSDFPDRQYAMLAVGLQLWEESI